MVAQRVPSLQDLKLRGDAAMAASKLIIEDIHENIAYAEEIRNSAEPKLPNDFDEWDGFASPRHSALR